MLLAVHHRVMEHLGSLVSTQEARVALGYASGNSYASFVLSKLPACSITRWCTLKHEPIVNCKATTKISNAFYERGLTIINFLRIFGTPSIKVEKNWPMFFKFQSFPSMTSVAIDDRKQFQCLQIVFNNKTRSLVLEFN